MTTREAWEKKRAAQAAAARSGKTLETPSQQPGKPKKLFRKTALAAAMFAVNAVADDSDSGSGSSCEIERVTSKKIRNYCTGQATFSCCRV